MTRGDGPNKQPSTIRITSPTVPGRSLRRVLRLTYSLDSHRGSCGQRMSVLPFPTRRMANFTENTTGSLERKSPREGNGKICQSWHSIRARTKLFKRAEKRTVAAATL